MGTMVYALLRDNAGFIPSTVVLHWAVLSALLSGFKAPCVAGSMWVAV